MTRPRHAILAAAAAAALLAGCGARGDAAQGDVRNDVKNFLLDNGYQAADGDTVEFSEGQADDAASCVAQAMFESDDFTKDERNDAARAADGEAPDEELVAKVQQLVDGCLDDARTAGPSAPTEEE